MSKKREEIGFVLHGGCGLYRGHLSAGLGSLAPNFVKIRVNRGGHAWT